MDYQILFNVAVAIIGALGGWIMKLAYQAIDELKCNHKSVSDQILALNLKLALEYVQKNDFKELCAKIEGQFDKMDDRLCEKFKVVGDQLDIIEREMEQKIERKADRHERVA